jgi:hypothetical protein
MRLRDFIRLTLLVHLGSPDHGTQSRARRAIRRQEVRRG